MEFKCSWCPRKFAKAMDLVAHLQKGCPSMPGPTEATHLDHSNCDHPRTKAGRAACRRDHG